MLPDLLKDLLADPASNAELTRALRAALLGPTLPIGAGMACTNATVDAKTAGVLAKFSAGSCTLDDSVITEASGKIGVGTTNPSEKLDVNGNVFVGGVASTNTGRATWACGRSTRKFPQVSRRAAR